MTEPAPPLAQSVEAAERLLGIARPIFPLVLSREAPVQRLIAAGLLARVIGSSEAAVRLSGGDRNLDLAVVIRTLYEHVVVLAWITGSDHERRTALWQRADHEQRSKIDREVSPLLGSRLMSDENAAAAERAIRSAGNARMPSLADCAKEADENWGSRLNAAGANLASLRAAYSITYRFASALAHPTLLGLNFVAEKAADKIVFQLEPQGGADRVMGLVPSFLGTALYITSDVMGSPRIHEVNAIFEWLSEQREPQ